MSDAINFYVIFDHPSDYPRFFVVRRQSIEGSVIVNHEAQLADTLEEARALVPSGLMLIPRSEEDDPVIVESWMD